MWSIDDKVDCSAAVVPKGLLLAGVCLADISWGLSGLRSQPSLCPSVKLGCGVRLLGFKAHTVSHRCVAFAKLLNFSVFQSPVSDGVNTLLISGLL